MNRLKLLCLILAILFAMAACFGGATNTDTYTASGVIKDVDDNPVEAVTLLFDGHGTAQTNEKGEWQKSGLRGSVTVTPAKEGYAFDPPTQVVTPTFARQVMFVGGATSLTISPTTITLQVDDTHEFIASGRDKYGQPVAVTPDWLVTGGIGFASPANGPTTTFTATTPGEGTVVAEDGDMVVYAIVTVLPRQNVSGIEVTHDIEPGRIQMDGGTVTISIDTETYDYGATVTLVAVPDEGWRFLGWEGDVESPEATIQLAVLDPDFEPANPFGVGSKSGITWRWPADDPYITYHPEVVAYGDTLTIPDVSRETAGEMLMAKFAKRTIQAVFEKE